MAVISLASAPAWAKTPEASTASPPLEKVSLQLKWFHQFQFAGYYAAIEQGYYAQEGLEVEIKERVLEKNFVKQVSAGESEYGVGDSGLLSQYAQGEKVTALAAIFQHNPLVFMAKQSSGIISPYEMRGKRVMSDIVSTNEAPLRAMLLGTGIADSDYQLIPQSNDYSLLTKGQVDVISGYLTDQPYYFMQQGVKVNVINPQNYGVDFYGDILFTSQQELKNHPDRADRFLRASLKGWRYALDHPEELIQIISKKYHSRLSIPHLRFEAVETRKLILPDVIPIGKIDASRMKVVADTYARSGLNRPLSNDELSAFIYKLPTQTFSLTAEENAWLAKHKTIKVGIDRDFPPYEWVDEHGEYVGLAADYLALIESRLGVRFEIVKDKSWAETLVMAKAGEIDLISFAVKTDERAQYLTFTEPYKISETVIVNRKSDGFVGNLQNLPGKRVAVENGYFMQELLHKEYPEFTLVVAEDTKEALQFVADGKADAYVGDVGTTSYAMKAEDFSGLHYSGQTPYSSAHSIAIVKAYPELASIITKAIASIPPADSERIISRWMGLKIERGIQTKTIVQYGLVLIFVLVIFAYWAARMRREIAIRKASELREQSRNRILEKLVTDIPLPTLLEEIIKEVEKTSPQMLCSILLLDDEGKHLVDGVAPSLPDFYNQAINGIEIGVGVGSCGTAAFTGQRVIVEDISTHAYWAAYKNLAARAGLASCWSQPILAASGKVLGTFAIYHAVKQVPAQLELSLIEQSAALASLAIERKRSAMKLIDSESRLSGIINAEPECIKILDAQGRLLQMNPAGLSMIEADSFEQVAGLPVPNLVAREYRSAYEKMHQSVIAGQSAQMDYEVVGLKGGRRWLETHAVPMKEANGDIVHLAITRDISARKQAEADLRIAATAFESQEGIIVTDASNRILRVNHAFTKITGYEAVDVVGKDPSMLSSGRQDKAFYAAMWRGINETGSWSGEIWNRRKSGEIYPESLMITAVKDTQGVVTNYVATLTDITVSKAASEEIKNLAFYDPLTSLPNRRLMMDRLKQALAASARSGARGAVLFLDLDHFKTLNDALGHDAGDLLLQQVSQRLTSCVREGDTVARLGGDEFVILLEGLSDQHIEAAKQTEAIAEKIIASLNQPYVLLGHDHHSTPSMGATLFNNHDAEIDVLMKQADIAMYQAKQSGRNTLRFFDPVMQQAIDKRVDIERELRKAIEFGHLVLHYQVQVNSAGRAIGAEALIRWQHPERGMIPPYHFIGLAEETGLILPIGQWVLETACAQLKLWQQDEATRELTLSVNVSAKQFLQEDFVENALSTVLQHGIDPQRLKFELTESILADRLESIVFAMNKLAEVGILFSLDDFGTGYSSLQYLKKLPLSQLKIDQSFVRDIVEDESDRAIVSTVIAMAQGLGLEVIAEGVESDVQRQYLMSKGCTYFQGYFFGKPVHVDVFENALRQQAMS